MREKDGMKKVPGEIWRGYGEAKNEKYSYGMSTEGSKK